MQAHVTRLKLAQLCSLQPAELPLRQAGLIVGVCCSELNIMHHDASNGASTLPK